MLGAARRVEDDAIAGSRLHQRGGEWRQPADVMAIQIDLVAADDTHRSLGSSGRGVAHCGSEEDLGRGAPGSGRCRVDHERRVDAFREKANATIDLSQAPFVVLVVGVFAAVAVAGGPGDDLCDGRTLSGEQKPQLVFQPLQTARGDVVFDGRARRLASCGLVAVRRGSPCEALLQVGLF